MSCLLHIYYRVCGLYNEIIKTLLLVEVKTVSLSKGKSNFSKNSEKLQYFQCETVVHAQIEEININHVFIAEVLFMLLKNVPTVQKKQVQNNTVYLYKPNVWKELSMMSI